MTRDEYGSLMRVSDSMGISENCLTVTTWCTCIDLANRYF